MVLALEQEKDLVRIRNFKKNKSCGVYRDLFMTICMIKEVAIGSGRSGSKENFVSDNNSLSSKEVDTVLRVNFYRLTG